MHTAPVLAVVVCHDGEAWLPLTLSALRRSSVRPQRIVAVDTGSTDRTAALLAEAHTGETQIVDDVLTLDADTGFAEAVSAAVDFARAAAADPGSAPDGETPDGGATEDGPAADREVHDGESASLDWVWILHDDSAPEADCLATLLNAAAAAPSAGVLGPLSVDWADPRLIVEAGLSTDASGHRRADVGLGRSRGTGEDHTRAEQSTEVLAMPSSGALVDLGLWDTLGGFDREVALFREDIDFGWRANIAGRTVLCVPRARIRHARAAQRGERTVTALTGSPASPRAVLAADRAYGLRTFLVNCSRFSFVVGLPRLLVLCVLRGIGFLVVKEADRARAEFSAVSYLVGGHGGLRSARADRSRLRELAAQAAKEAPAQYRGRGAGVRGLFIGRFTRLRHAVRAWVVTLVRQGVASDAALGRLPETVTVTSAWIPPESLRGETRGAPAISSSRAHDVVAVPLEDEDLEAAAERAQERADATDSVPAGESAAEAAGDTAAAVAAEPGAEAAVEADASAPPAPPAIRRPTPVSRDAAGAPPAGLVFVEVNRRRILAATLFAPPVLLLLALSLLAVVVNAGRFGLDLAGGRLLPVGELGQVWSSYLAAWHSVGGGTSAHAPAALAVLGVLGAPFFPIGGPAAVVATLFLFDLPLAGLSAYVATRRLRVRRWVRALVAAGYAVLPPATAAVAQGRIDVVVVHILLPLLIAGVATVLKPSDGGTRWLSASVTLALGLAILGAFSPLVHALALVGLLAGFVVVHSTVALGRRVASVATVVLLPIALLLPWPATLLTHPEVLVHGVGARVPEVPVSGGELFSLDPGGAGTLPIGAALIAAALVALVLRPTLRALAGFGIVALGGVALAVVLLVPLPPTGGGAARHGWAGAPLLVIGAGLLAIVLAVAYQERGPRASAQRPASAPRVLAAAGGAAVLAVLVVAAVVAGPRGPLRPADDLRLAAPVASELADTGRSVLVLSPGGEPPRQAGGGMPAFGDDDYPLPPETPRRLQTWQDILVGGPGVAPAPQQVVRDVLASASAAGVLFVVLPPGVPADGILFAGGEIVTSAASTQDGRQVVRLKSVSGQVTLIAPELSKLAIEGKAPPGDVDGQGVAPVDAQLPDVRVRVSDGPGGRLLVLAATFEAGWRAEVDGKPKPIVPAWGHQVGVEVPTRESEVIVENSDAVRNVLLLGQVGAVLFTLLTAIPARRGRRPQSPSITSGSMPR